MWTDRNVRPTCRPDSSAGRFRAGGGHPASQVSPRVNSAEMIPCCSRSFVGLGTLRRARFDRPLRQAQCKQHKQGKSSG